MAIFKRGRKQSILKKMQESVWPTMGWARTLTYYRHRVFRTGDSTYKITAGLAAGMSISFSPFLGTHFLQCFVAAFILRANWIAAFVGTALGNPWTFPFLFAVAYKVGTFFCDLMGFADFIALPDDATFAHFMDQPFDFLSFLYAHPLKFLLPMTVGGYMCAVFSWPLFYGALYYPVRAARTAYRLQRVKRRRARLYREMEKP